VQLGLFPRRALVLGGLAASLPALAGPVEEQDASYEVRFFSDSDDVRVGSHFLRYGLDFTNGMDALVQWNLERVLIPAVDAPPGSQEAVDAITSASRPISSGNGAFQDFEKARNEIQADLGTQALRGGYYVSLESDYFAQMVRASANRDFLRKNLNVTVGTSYGWDVIEPLPDDDTGGGNDSRTTWHGHAVLTQVLTPTTVLRVGAEVNAVEGLQHSPYRNVYAGGGSVPERHPDRRNRRDLFAGASQYFKNRSSVKADYRYYTDDWGVRSHTLGGTLNQVITDHAVVQYRYRYYDQGAATFYRAEYEDPEGVDGYRTGDYRLQDFVSHLFGAQLTLNLGAFHERQRVLRNLDLKLRYERYMNSNNFSANVFESGLAYRF